MHHHLKRVSDPEYLLCHKCGLPLLGSAHKKCAEAARIKSGLADKEPSKIKHALSTRPFEGIGTIGHSPCRLEDGSIIIPAEEARKIREEGFVCKQTRVKYGPWTHGRLREPSRIQRRKEIEIIIEEIKAEDYGDYDSDEDDLFSLAYGYSHKIHLAQIFSSEISLDESTPASSML